MYNPAIGPRSRNHSKNQKHYQPPKAWTEAKKERSRQIGGWQCEICLSFPGENKTIGHHITGNHLTGPNTATNCELRCKRCEGSYNSYKRKGFSPETAREAVIRRYRIPDSRQIEKSRETILVLQPA